MAEFRIKAGYLILIALAGVALGALCMFKSIDNNPGQKAMVIRNALISATFSMPAGWIRIDKIAADNLPAGTKIQIIGSGGGRYVGHTIFSLRREFDGSYAGGPNAPAEVLARGMPVTISVTYEEWVGYTRTLTYDALVGMKSQSFSESTYGFYIGGHQWANE